MPRATIDPETKARALADLMDGDQPATVAARYNIPGTTVRKWKERLVTPDVTESVTSGVTKRISVVHRPAVETQQLAIGELIMENLRAKLLATQKIAEYATVPTWFDKQTAADVATLFEVLDRSAISVLDRLAAARAADSTASTAEFGDDG
jgi:hypothetical protein